MTIEELRGLSEHDLLVAIGRELVQADTPAFPFQPEQLIRVANDWLAQRRQSLRSLLCNDARLRELCQHASAAEDGLLIGHVVGLLADRIEIHAGLVAILLIRRGLHGLCGPVWR